MAYIETSNASDAYRAAGYSQNATHKTINEAACRLLADSKVAARVRELQAIHAEKHGYTVERIAGMLEEDRQFARDLEAPSAATTATFNLAKLHGLVKEKHEHTGPNGGPIQIEQVRADATAFRSRIAGLIAPADAGEGVIISQH